MRRYKVFKRFKNSPNQNGEMSFNKWSMYHGDDVKNLFGIMYNQFKSINNDFLDMDNYNIILMDFMRHVYKYSNKYSY